MNRGFGKSEDEGEDDSDVRKAETIEPPLSPYNQQSETEAKEDQLQRLNLALENMTVNGSLLQDGQVLPIGSIPNSSHQVG